MNPLKSSQYNRLLKKNNQDLADKVNEIANWITRHDKPISPNGENGQPEAKEIKKLGMEDLSNCCKSDIMVVSGDEGTSHYECIKCKKACDIFKPEVN